jgi:hypothetical protein
MMNSNYERNAESDTPSPVGEQCNDRSVNTTKEMPPFEDSMGGLVGVYSAEEHGAVSIKRNKSFFLLLGGELSKKNYHLTVVRSSYLTMLMQLQRL